MGGGVLAWTIVILILIIVYAIHLAKCFKYFESRTEHEPRGINRRVVRTITIPARAQPYSISNRNLQTDIEQGLHFSENSGSSMPVASHSYQHSEGYNIALNNQLSEIKDDKDPPSYDEVIAQDLQTRCTQSIPRPVVPP